LYLTLTLTQSILCTIAAYVVAPHKLNASLNINILISIHNLNNITLRYVNYKMYPITTPPAITPLGTLKLHYI